MREENYGSFSSSTTPGTLILLLINNLLQLHQLPLMRLWPLWCLQLQMFSWPTCVFPPILSFVPALLLQLLFLSASSVPFYVSMSTPTPSSPVPDVSACVDDVLATIFSDVAVDRFERQADNATRPELEIIDPSTSPSAPPPVPPDDLLIDKCPSLYYLVVRKSVPSYLT